MTDFSHIFAPSRPSRDQASPCGSQVHDSGRIGAPAGLHDFYHLDAFERESAAGETQHVAENGHGNAQAARQKRSV